MASARAAVLAPSAAAVTDAAERWPAEARRALVEEFLASPQAAELRDPFARKVPHLLAMCCVGHLGCEPVLIGPSVLERVLVDALPRAAIAPDRFGKAVPQAVRAWTDWLAERNKLTDRSRRRLGFSLRATLARFAGAWYGPGAHPLRRYLVDGEGVAQGARTECVGWLADGAGDQAQSAEARLAPYGGSLQSR